MSTLAINKKASFDYELIEKYEAGLVLFGYEVKSARDGQINLSGSYISVRGAKNKRSQLYLVNASFSLYKMAKSIKDYNPSRDRQLLLHKKEIDSLLGKKQQTGLTLIPLKIYTNHSFIKLEFALARGKKKFDKRESIKKRELDRRLRTLTKRKSASGDDRNRQ